MKCDTQTCDNDRKVSVRWKIVTQTTYFCFKCALNHYYLVRHRKGQGKDIYYRRLTVQEIFRG